MENEVKIDGRGRKQLKINLFKDLFISHNNPLKESILDQALDKIKSLPMLPKEEVKVEDNISDKGIDVIVG